MAVRINLTAKLVQGASGGLCDIQVVVISNAACEYAHNKYYSIARGWLYMRRSAQHCNWWRNSIIESASANPFLRCADYARDVQPRRGQSCKYASRRAEHKDVSRSSSPSS